MGSWTNVILFAAGGAAFVLAALLVSKAIRPHRPNEEKTTAYESGEQAVGSAWAQFPVRFYIIALVFLLFEVEILFMFPWAVVFADGAAHTETAGRWGWFAFAEMVIFILVLAAGLAYAWRKGHLQWPKPLQASTSTDSHVPQQFYDAVNERYKPAR